ncbi:MAG TPA: Rpn family recombination-promoting nuclease/putative transposase [Polyangiales bacterium]
MSAPDDFDRPHDTLFRYAFERPEIAEGELRTLLPPEVTQALDFSTLTLEPGSLADPEFAQFETDLLYRVQLAGEDSFVFILFEHQSRPDALMPYRMLRCMVRIWERWWRAQPSPPRRVPVIVPPVLSNAERPWSAPGSLSELYAAPAGVLVALGPHLLDFSLRIDDLPAHSSVSLRARAGLHHFGRLALFALQRAHTSAAFVAELARWLDELRELVAVPEGMDDFALLMRYIHRTADFPTTQLCHLVRRLGSRAEEIAMTAAERLKAEGRAEGEALGKVSGQAELVLKLLSLRFGVFPEQARNRVGQASLDQLAVFAERVLSAGSLDEVLR